MERRHSVTALARTQSFLHRTACFLTVLALLLLLIFAAVTFQLLIIVMERGDRHQGEKDTVRLSPGSSSKQQQIPDVMKPCAIIRAPCCNNTNGKYLLWEHEQGMARCLGGFHYSDGDLVVPRKGMYRVFLQITFASKTKCSGELPLKIIVFALMESYNEDIHLLSSVDTVNCNMTQWKKSLHTTGIVYLEAKSRLRVKSSYPELIISDENFVFFGAELVTELPDSEI
ncbi:lymphotoxin-alpha-like [Solea senegalensis]|uniref:Lymphotoxin-alpha-like n=1 Tax=Solea senegalensis TaxID=28829 RepID=A0AAV6PG95_SOLSE|nr:tumor necrosis factor ligand superfamily member 15-like isoform X1 [Solea senegalensis]KAG7461455.1 lymphotoxin-alpha-like [Solea senegalensis]